ncbi:hypothetical protein Tco_0816077 [Tanacetum coccineum]
MNYYLNCYCGTQDTANTNELLSQLLQQVGKMGLLATNNSPGPTSTCPSRRCGCLSGVVGPSAGLVCPSGFQPQTQGSSCLHNGPVLMTPAQQQHLSPCHAHPQILGSLTAGSAQPTSQPGNMGLPPVSGQATTLQHAFNTETLQDLSSGA